MLRLHKPAAHIVGQQVDVVQVPAEKSKAAGKAWAGFVGLGSISVSRILFASGISAPKPLTLDSKVRGIEVRTASLRDGLELSGPKPEHGLRNH